MIEAYLDSIGDTGIAKATALAELERRCRELRIDCEASAALQAEVHRRLAQPTRA